MSDIKGQTGETKWHRLDNTAIVFPVISNKYFSGVYRLSVRLQKEIQPELLQKALDVTIPWFDSFLVRLRRGFFWYYLESNRKRPLVQEEKNGPCGYIDPVSNANFLFRVIYYKNRISLEVFHALSDGSGSFDFLKELTLCYLRLSEPELGSINSAILPCAGAVTCDSEDSYLKNYREADKLKLFSEKSYQIRGERLSLYSTGVMHGYIHVDEILALCRKKGVTITQYFTAIMIWSIYIGNMNRRPSKYPVKVFVPVNLRPFFDSTSTKNFFSNISIGFTFGNKEYTFEDVLTATCEQYKQQMSKDLFVQKIAANVRLGKNIFARFLPLPIKNFVLRIGYLLSFESNSTTLSNLGSINVPDQYVPYIDSFTAFINVANREPVKCGLCSFENKFVITFTSRHKDAYIQKAFFRKLAEDGLSVSIETNGVYYEDL